MEKCPACAAVVTKQLGRGIVDMKKHISKCAEHERRWVREGKKVHGQPVPTPHLDYLNKYPIKTMAKEPEKAATVRVKETVGFTREGITVFTTIDYATRQISLVNKDGSKKQWLFAQRKPEYLPEWRRILEAMHFAVVQAEMRLDEQPED